MIVSPAFVVMIGQRCHRRAAESGPPALPSVLCGCVCVAETADRALVCLLVFVCVYGAVPSTHPTTAWLGVELGYVHTHTSLSVRPSLSPSHPSHPLIPHHPTSSHIRHPFHHHPTSVIRPTSSHPSHPFVPSSHIIQHPTSVIRPTSSHPSHPIRPIPSVPHHPIRPIRPTPPVPPIRPCPLSCACWSVAAPVGSSALLA